MENNTVPENIIVLGGTDGHIALLKQLKERGYRTILVDYLERPVAKDYADVHVQESTYDKEAVLKAAKEYNAKAVMTICVDQVNTTACYVSEKLGLPIPYSYETAKRIVNKAEMKRTMLSCGVPTSRYFTLEPGEEQTDFSLNFPVIVKPVDNHGATGVKVANTQDELDRFIEDARNSSKTGRILVEEFFTGKEVSAYTIVEDGIARIVMISERLSVSEGQEQVMKCYATITPPDISEEAHRKLQDAANKIAAAFGLQNTPLHVQAIINGADINVIEFAARLAGGLSTGIIKRYAGVDMMKVAIDCWFNERKPVNPQKLDCYHAVNLVYGKDGTYDHMDGIDKFLDDGTLEDVRVFRHKGKSIIGTSANGCRVAAFVTNGNSREELHKKAVEIFQGITVVGTDGTDLTRRDLII